MANATKAVEGDVGTLETDRFVVDGSNSITIPYEVQAGSVKVRGLTEDASKASSGKFKVTITQALEGTDGSTKIEFDSGDAPEGETLRVSYKRRVVNGQTVSIATNSTTAKGALYAHYPIYSSGTDCTEAAIKAWLHIYIPRVRVTALPGLTVKSSPFVW